MHGTVSGVTATVDRRSQIVLAAPLTATAALYLSDLSAKGYGNLFYAAAAEAGSHSWSAWFFGSLDANNVITVDKPPASLWVTGLSVRLFGMNSWSVLAPQALMVRPRWRCCMALCAAFSTMPGRERPPRYWPARHWPAHRPRR